MRFNSKELMAVAIQPSYKFDKEGALYIKEKQEGLFRRSDVFTQRWCRLRGNLLFYYKSKDQYSEPAGVFVLEQCSVKLEPNAEMPHTFSLVFQGDGYGQQLAAGSEGERDSWIQALHMASYEYMRSQLSSLKEKLKSKKADEDWSISQTSVSKRHRSFTTGSSCDPQLYEPFMELSICCDNLKCDGDGQPPSPLVCVSINTPPLLNWVKFAQTEVIEKSSNPCFLTTVTFVKGEVSELSRVKLSVYDVRERVTCTSTLLGGSAFTLYNLIQSQHRSLRLTLISPSCASVGFITVSARELNSAQQRNAWLQLEEEGSLWSKVERPRSYSLPTKLTSQVATPVLGQLKTLSSNFTTQTYRFHTGLGAELHVHEIMAESKLTFYVPQMLLNLWINEEKRLMDNILLLGELSDEWQQKQLAATESHLHLINHYTETVNFLSTQKNSSFKPSAKKKDISFEFIPVNLHLQRMWVQNVTTRKTGVYDIVTVGAFSAFSQRFRHGGLLRLLNQLKAYSPLISRDNGSAILGPDPISRSAEAIKRIEQIKEEIEKDLQNILVYSEQKAGSALQTVLNSLSSKGNQLTHVCLPQLVDDASSLWETIRPNSADGKVCLYPEMSSITISDKLESSKGSDSVKPDVVPSKEHDNPVELKDTKAAKKNDATHGDDVNNITHNLKKDEECNGHISPEHEKNDESFPCKSNDNSSSSSSKSSPDEMEPLDLTHLNIKASIMCMASKVQYFVNESKTASSGGQQAASDGQETNWTAELMPSIKKLRQAIRCLYKTANSTYGLISLKESATSSSLSQIVRYRRDIVFSQGLTSLITGLMTRIWCQDPDAMFVHMLRTVGVLAHFEGLLSCYGDEMGALEDMVVGVDDLRRVLFWLEPCDSCINPLPRIDGSRLYLSVVIPAPQSVISLLPKEFSTGCHFTVSSVFFNIGINEQAMLAEKFGDTSLQEKINLDSLNLLKDHYSRFQRAAKNLKNHGFRYSESHITELMQQLESQVLSKKSKNVEILHLAAEICRHLGGIRFTSCKSAKDRTSMSVTLEQTMVLLKDFNLDEKEMHRVLECMRSVGTRRENTLKNVGVRKYAFTSLQLMTVPKLYRPPAGTYGSVAS